MRGEHILTARCDEFPIFIMASGARCGSTLLQRLLNSHEQVLIWGEQCGFLSSFILAIEELLDWKKRYEHHRQIYLTEGHNVFSSNLLPLEDEIVLAAQIFVQSLFAVPALNMEKSRWGFKEVKYDATVAMFLHNMFPNARVVHLTRHIIDCFISLKHWENEPGTWTRQSTECELQTWQRINESFLAIADPLPWLLTMRYEDLVNEPKEELTRLCAFLGLSMEDLDLAVFRDRLHQEGPKGGEERPFISRRSLADSERGVLLRPPIPEISAALGYVMDFDRD
jgi:hypothetical protein